MAKWPNHFISSKQFQKRPNGNPGKREREEREWKGRGEGKERERTRMEREMICQFCFPWNGMGQSHMVAHECLEKIKSQSLLSSKPAVKEFYCPFLCRILSVF